MDEEYDVIVVGTGLKECILSGLMSVGGKKVLHMDRNGYYGGESASLNLNQLYEQQKGGEKPPPEMGQSRNYNIDLIPKFIMASGKLVSTLLYTKTTRYLEFKQIEGSYVMNKKGIHKVPATEKEALNSGLMGLLEKRRFRSFLIYVQEYDPEKPETHKKRNLKTMTAAELYKDFSLAQETIDFVGHALCLYTTDEYLSMPAEELALKCQLYSNSLAAYGKSPYIYPLYGLGELPQAFSRLSAVHGGTYMLNKPVEGIVYDDNGKVCGVTSEGQTAKCKIVIGDPSYFPDKVQKTGQVVRCIAILDHVIQGTDNCQSCQIIIPQTVVGRKNDIYVTMLGKSMEVSDKGKYVAIVSTEVETAEPAKELIPGLQLLGEIKEKFFSLSDTFTPTDDGSQSNVFITTSYDATSHFETSTKDVLSLFEKITGSPLDLSNISAEDEEQ